MLRIIGQTIEDGDDNTYGVWIRTTVQEVDPGPDMLPVLFDGLPDDARAVVPRIYEVSIGADASYNDRSFLGADRGVVSSRGRRGEELGEWMLSFQDVVYTVLQERFRRGTPRAVLVLGAQ